MPEWYAIVSPPRTAISKALLKFYEDKVAVYKGVDDGWDMDLRDFKERRFAIFKTKKAASQFAEALKEKRCTTEIKKIHT